MKQRIDVYVDVKNRNNSWAMITYVEYKNHIPHKRQDIIRFDNAQNEVNYIRQYFNGDEIFYHKVDYEDVECLVYKDKPELDHVDVRFKEYKDGKVIPRKMSFYQPLELPKMYFADLFREIIRINKGLSRYEQVDGRYYRVVDGRQREQYNQQELIKSVKITVGNFFDAIGDRVKRIGKGENFVRNLKIFVASSALVTLLAGGVHKYVDIESNSDYIEQKDPIRSVQDIGTYLKKGDIGVIIEKLMDGRYDEVSPQEIEQAMEFIRTLESGNYNKNTTYSTFSYTDYFKYKVGSDDNIDYLNASEVLFKIDSLYKKAVYVVDGKPVVNQENAKKYLDYVCSLTFMYDTYHTQRPVSYFTNNTQSLISPYATDGEIKAYDKFPGILKFIILNQADTLLRKVDYKVDQTPVYYFKGTDKYTLLSELSKRIDLAIDSLYYNCGYHNPGQKM